MKVEIKNGYYLSLEKETMLNLLICIVWALVLVGYSKGIINRLPVLGDHSEETQAAIVVIPLLLALPALINKFCLVDYLFYFLCVFYYLASYVFFPENSEYLTENAFLCICCSFPFYFIGRLIDIDKFFNIFVYLSVACIAMDLFYFLIYAPGQKNMAEVANDDNMYRAYKSLPHVAMLLWATLEKFKIWKLVMFVSGMLFLLACGTRGPLVCLGFFGIIYFFFFMNFKGAIYVKGAIIVTITIVFMNLTEIVRSLAYTFTGLNLSTRILDKFITGGLSNDSQRGALRDIIYNALDKSDYFWGMGPFGCRNFNVIYPHFLPLDFICTFGYLFGYILLFLVFLIITWSLWLSKGTKAQIFISFLISICIIKLMLTGTFLFEPFFYFLIGTCANEIFKSVWQNRV